MKPLIPLEYSEFKALYNDMQSYTAKKIKKAGIHYCNKSSGAGLLHFSMDNFSFMEKLLEAGIDINQKDNHGLNAAYSIIPSVNPYQNLKLLCKHNIDLSQSSGYNILKYLSEKYSINCKEEEEELSKIQILLLSKCPDLLQPENIPPQSDQQCEKINILSYLTPDTLRYLKNYKNVDVFNMTDDLGGNLLFEIMGSTVYQSSYASTVMLERLLQLMKPDEINHLNGYKENALWFAQLEDEKKLPLLKKYGMDFKNKNWQNQGILEGVMRLNLLLAKQFSALGSDISEKGMIEICSMSAEEVQKTYDWDETYYNFILPIAKKQYSLYEKKEIINNMDKSIIYSSKRNSRI